MPTFWEVRSQPVQQWSALLSLPLKKCIIYFTFRYDVEEDPLGVRLKIYGHVEWVKPINFMIKPAIKYNVTKNLKSSGDIIINHLQTMNWVFFLCTKIFYSKYSWGGCDSKTISIERIAHSMDSASIYRCQSTVVVKLILVSENVFLFAMKLNLCFFSGPRKWFHSRLFSDRQPVERPRTLNMVS